MPFGGGPAVRNDVETATSDEGGIGGPSKIQEKKETGVRISQFGGIGTQTTRLDVITEKLEKRESGKRGGRQEIDSGRARGKLSHNFIFIGREPPAGEKKRIKKVKRVRCDGNWARGTIACGKRTDEEG